MPKYGVHGASMKARITAICAREERPFLVRHLDGSPAVGSRSSFSAPWHGPGGRPCTYQGMREALHLSGDEAG